MKEPWQVEYYLNNPPRCEPCAWQHTTTNATHRASHVFRKRPTYMCNTCYELFAESPGWLLQRQNLDVKQSIVASTDGDSFDFVTDGRVNIYRCSGGRFATLREVVCWATAHAEFWGLGLDFEGVTIKEG